MVCSLWNKRCKDEFISKFLLMNLVHGVVTVEGKINEDAINNEWKAEGDVEIDKIGSFYRVFIKKAKAIYTPEKREAVFTGGISGAGGLNLVANA
jgi:hypothetical protein